MGSKKSARPKHVSSNVQCTNCGMHDLMTKSNKCRICDPDTFYNEYKSHK